MNMNKENRVWIVERNSFDSWVPTQLPVHKTRAKARNTLKNFLSTYGICGKNYRISKYVLVGRG